MSSINSENYVVNNKYKQLYVINLKYVHLRKD